MTAWYVKAASYIQGTPIRVAFVSTNSITQGEQVGVLWRALFDQGVKIHFAHRTFAWESEARGKAHVHVVIIGFGAFDFAPKRLYEYEAVASAPAGKSNNEGADRGGCHRRRGGEHQPVSFCRPGYGAHGPQQAALSGAGDCFRQYAE